MPRRSGVPTGRDPSAQGRGSRQIPLEETVADLTFNNRRPESPATEPTAPGGAVFMESSESTSSAPETKREKTLVVQNKMGIHARPAAMIVRAANKFQSEIFFEKDQELVNGKSIMGLMMLAAGSGSKLKAVAEGDDSEDLLRELEELFERKFDEP